MEVFPAFVGSVQELIQSWMQALDHVDLSVREGKAVELMKERLTRLPGVQEVKVEECEPQIQYGGSPVITVLGTAPEGLTRETQFIITMAVAKVNMRYGTRVTVRFASSPDHGVERRTQH
jgi:hypothetical protein